MANTAKIVDLAINNKYLNNKSAFTTGPGKTSQNRLSRYVSWAISNSFILLDWRHNAAKKSDFEWFERQMRQHFSYENAIACMSKISKATKRNSKRVH